jgi:hypothetical protein
MLLSVQGTNKCSVASGGAVRLMSHRDAQLVIGFFLTFVLKRTVSIRE